MLTHVYYSNEYNIVLKEDIVSHSRQRYASDFIFHSLKTTSQEMNMKAMIKVLEQYSLNYSWRLI
jgi:hypothetical protein